MLLNLQHLVLFFFLKKNMVQKHHFKRVARRWLDPHRNLENDWRKGGRHIQLLLDIDTRLPNGGLIALKFLLDTGAQVNLIK